MPWSLLKIIIHKGNNSEDRMTTAKVLQLSMIFNAIEPFKLKWYHCLEIMRVGSCEISLKTVGKSYYIP